MKLQTLLFSQTIPTCVVVHSYTQKNNCACLKYTYGVPKETDILDLFALARKVGSFTLTDNPADSESSISSGSFIRLAQLQIPGIPFFPSLNRLRIEDADESVDQLNFFLTNSLRSLEVVNIDKSKWIPLLMFLYTLTVECPHLTSITFSPIQAAFLAPCLAFKDLRRLELDGAVSGIDFKELVAIGKSLPELETFILDAEIGDYEPRILIPQVETDDAWEVAISVPVPEVGSQEGIQPVAATMEPSPGGPEEVKTTSDLCPSDDCAPQDGATSLPTSPTKKTPPLPDSTFQKLKKLHVVGCLELIQDLLSLCSGLEDVSMILVRPDELIDSDITRETDIFTSIIEGILSRTDEKRLTRLFIGQRCELEDSELELPILPSHVVKKMLLHPTLEHLEISNWKLLAAATSLSCLAPSPLHFESKLKTLHFPVGSINRGINLSELRRLAVTCPGLVSLQSTIMLDLKNLPPYELEQAVNDPLSHNLKLLSIGSVEGSSWTLRTFLTVARHLFVLFPALQKIQTHEGQDTLLWTNIYIFFSTYRTVCLDNNARSPTPRVLQPHVNDD